MFTTKAAFNTRSDNTYANRELTIEEMRMRLNLDKKTNISGLGEETFSAMAEENKRRKLELMHGKKDLLKGIYNGITTSTYNEAYR